MRAGVLTCMVGQEGWGGGGGRLHPLEGQADAAPLAVHGGHHGLEALPHPHHLLRLHHPVPRQLRQVDQRLRTPAPCPLSAGRLPADRSAAPAAATSHCLCEEESNMSASRGRYPKRGAAVHRCRAAGRMQMPEHAPANMLWLVAGGEGGGGGGKGGKKGGGAGAHVGAVEFAVLAAKGNKGAVVHQRPHHALHHLPPLQPVHHVVPVHVLLREDQHLLRHVDLRPRPTTGAPRRAGPRIASNQSYARVLGCCCHAWGTAPLWPKNAMRQGTRRGKLGKWVEWKNHCLETDRSNPNPCTKVVEREAMDVIVGLRLKAPSAPPPPPPPARGGGGGGRG